MKPPSAARRTATAPTPEGAVVCFGPIGRPQKASELAAERIRELILNGQIGEGSQLPPETQLVSQLGVSRSTLREAFRILETEDLISVSRGSRTGARVHLPGAATPARYAGQALRAAGATVAETYEAQLAFEPFAARLLAERADNTVLSQLRTAVEDLEGHLATADFEQLSVGLARFHRLMVELTGNRTLAIMAEMLGMILETHQVRHNSNHRPLRTTGATQSRKFRELGPKSIRKLLTLIEAGDADGAEAHWRSHLKNAADFWLDRMDVDAVIGAPTGGG